MSDELNRNQMLASTAYWTAAVRARESAREDRLFNDPWAADLAGSAGLAWVEERAAENVVAMVLRTRYFDDFLQCVAAEKGVRQIVLVAAGLDTRAYRLRWPEQTQIFELEQAAVLTYKAHILESVGANPTCEHHPIAVDLTTSWETALTAAGFDPQYPSVWLLEGFLFYLSPENLIRVLERAMNLAVTGSFVGFDIINSLTLTSPLTKAWVEMQANSGAPWIGTMDDPQAFLAARNWQATVTPLGAPPTNYDRWPGPVIPATIPGMPHLWFVTAQKD